MRSTDKPEEKLDSFNTKAVEAICYQLFSYFGYAEIKDMFARQDFSERQAFTSKLIQGINRISNSEQLTVAQNLVELCREYLCKNVAPQNTSKLANWMGSFTTSADGTTPEWQRVQEALEYKQVDILGNRPRK